MKFRPGNAAVHSIADHVEVLDAAVEALGGDFAVGHREGDDPGLVKTPLRVRVDLCGVHAILEGMPRT